ncbi:MAG: DUF5681 domain-containing protein, partial [Pseudomonadota bacterium]
LSKSDLVTGFARQRFIRIFGKPPVNTRFKPGQSGNPKGRPKGAKNKKSGAQDERLMAIVMDEAYRDISVNEGQHQISMPMAQAVMRAIGLKAIKGDHRSQRLFTELVSGVERTQKARDDAWLEATIGYKVEWSRELHRRETLGITDLLEPVPLPDDIHIDFVNNLVTIQGPFTPEEKNYQDHLLEKRAVHANELDALLDERAHALDQDRQDFLDDQLRYTRAMLEIIDRRLSGE